MWLYIWLAQKINALSKADIDLKSQPEQVEIGLSLLIS